MEDKDIIQLYLMRSERAVEETDTKYRNYLMKVAKNILDNESDSEECLNDTLMTAWKSIPPNRPDNFKIYLARIIKNKALNVIHHNNAEKRGGGQYTIAFDELYDSVSSSDTPEKSYMDKLNREIIRGFLLSLPTLERKMFVRRYWFGEGSSVIGKAFDKPGAYVNMKLSRIRKKMKQYLMEVENS